MAVRIIRKWWHVDIRIDGERIRRKCPHNSKASARAFEARLLQRHALGQKLFVNNGATFREFVQKWMKTYVETNNKPSEQRAKISTFKCHLDPYFGRFKLTEVTLARIEAYKAKKLSVGLSAKSINNHLAMLRKCLQSALDWEEIDRVPRFKLLKVPPQKIDYLSDSEVAALMGMEASMNRLMVITALDTGMRLGELIGLRWEAVDFGRGKVTVSQSIVRGIPSSPKSNRNRYVPMTRRLRNELYLHRKPSGYVFTRQKGEVHSDMTAAVILRNACKEVGIRRVGWHKLRHTFASRMVSRGASMRELQQLMGHSTIAVTERYAHLAPNVLDTSVRILDDDLMLDSANWAPNGHRLTASALPVLTEARRKVVE